MRTLVELLSQELNYQSPEPPIRGAEAKKGEGDVAKKGKKGKKGKKKDGKGKKKKKK
jgi:hypothetical protein